MVDADIVDTSERQTAEAPKISTPVAPQVAVTNDGINIEPEENVVAESTVVIATTAIVTKTAEAQATETTESLVGTSDEAVQSEQANDAVNIDTSVTNQTTTPIGNWLNTLFVASAVPAIETSAAIDTSPEISTQAESDLTVDDMLSSRLLNTCQ